MNPLTLTQTDTDTQREPGEPFTINSQDAANWLLRKLAGIENERLRVQQQAALIVKQLETDAARLHHLYGEQLEQFTRAELARQGNRRKSLTLLQGTCAFRTVPQSVKISDPTAALDYARAALPESIRTHETLDVTFYRQAAQTALENDGEALPGIETVPARETFRVTFGFERTNRVA